MSDKQKLEALTKALVEILERWDGADDCTAAVARGRKVLEAVRG